MTVEMMIKDAVYAASKEAKAEGIAEGIAEGKAEGKADEKKATVFRMLDADIAEDVILIATALTEDELRPIVEEYHSMK